MLSSGKARKPETFEFGQAEQLLSGIYLLLQQVIHTTAQKGAKHPKKFRGKPWPSVATALDALEDADRLARAEATKAFMAMFEPVPEDEFEADLAEHRAALEVGAEQSPPQQRAAEQAGFDLGWGPAPSSTPGGLGAPLTPTFSDQPAPAAPALPAPAGRLRDPATGRFLPTPTAAAPEPQLPPDVLEAAVVGPQAGGWADYPPQP